MSQTTLVLTEPLSLPRIGGIATALAVHVVAFMLLMAPMSYLPPMPAMEDVTLVPVFDPPKEIQIPKPPDLTYKPENKPSVQPIRQTPATAAPDISAIVAVDSSTNDTQVIAPTTELVGVPIEPASGPISLSTDFAPAPRYPPMSLRHGQQGTVILLVKVDALGHPIDASIKKSSGFRELDQNALKHVLATWRFHPAMFNGIAIPSLALVPVAYNID